MEETAANENPLVSVLCITFNQEQYIGETLKSILAQKTNFPFEIIVHDDASTDSTLSIVRQFEEQNPKKIIVIEEKENQYNQLPPGGYLEGIMRPYVRGKYIAVCEGDDYWLNEFKLQKQVDFLESHHECTAVCHQATVIEGRTSELIGVMGAYGNEPRDLHVEDLLEFWDIPTASLVYRADIMDDFAERWTFERPVGDFPRAIYLASKGYIHYLPEEDSVYRYRTSGSYSASTNNVELEIDRAKLWINMNKEMNIATNFKYEKQFDKNSAHQVRKIAINKGVISCMQIKEYRKYLKEFSGFKILKMIIERMLNLIGFKFVSVGWRQYRLVRYKD